MNRPMTSLDGVAEASECRRRSLRKDSQIDEVAMSSIPYVAKREIDACVRGGGGPWKRVGEFARPVAR